MLQLDFASQVADLLAVHDDPAALLELEVTSLPFNVIKIDRSIVTTTADNPTNALIVSSVVDLGHTLETWCTDRLAVTRWT